MVLVRTLGACLATGKTNMDRLQQNGHNLTEIRVRIPVEPRNAFGRLAASVEELIGAGAAAQIAHEALLATARRLRRVA